MENHEGGNKPEEVQVDEVKVDVNSLQEQLNQLKQTNERLLNESKENKNKYRALRDEVEVKQQKNLEEDERWKELLDIEKNKNHEITSKLDSMINTALKKEVQFEVAKYASDAYDLNDIVSNLPSDLVKVDKENLSVAGVQEAVAKIKEQKPHLFKPEKPAQMIGNRPTPGDMKPKTFKEMSSVEQDAELVELLKQM